MSDATFTVVVETEPGPVGEPLVRRFRLGKREIEVAETHDRWPGADHLHVTWILRQGRDDGWRLVLFRDPRTADAPG